MESNPQLELAYDFLEYTGVNVFLTGKAGTGKEQPPDYFMSDRLGGLFDRHAGFCLSEA